MEMALYWPELGYYRRKTEKVFGVHGDFYTAAQLQPVFGELLGSFVAGLHRLGDADPAFGVVELGAGQQNLREPLSRWNYRAFDWNTDPPPPATSGLIIANEFFDALPVHLLRRRNARWVEVSIKAANSEAADGQWMFGEADTVSPELLNYAEHYGKAIPEGGLLEASLSAKEWIVKIHATLLQGDVLIFDYGYEKREILRFPQGTLLAYRRHSAIADVLDSPGTRDISAHVNFTYLKNLALSAGFEVVRQSSLAEWVLSVWDQEMLATQWKQADHRWRLQWKQLVFGMGEVFRVLHLRKRTQR